MPDNITAPATGQQFATDEIGGVHHPRNKIGFGADGAYADVTPDNPFPVVDAGVGKLGSARRFFAIAPANNALPAVPDAIYVGGDGDLVLRGDDGADATFAVVAGQILPVSPAQVRAGTTATGLIGLIA